MITEISAREYNVMAHALGAKSRTPGYRNYFCTGEGSDDYPICEGLVAKGLMNRLPPSGVFPDYMYVVTKYGRKFVLPAKEEK